MLRDKILKINKKKKVNIFSLKKKAKKKKKKIIFIELTHNSTIILSEFRFCVLIFKRKLNYSCWQWIFHLGNEFHLFITFFSVRTIFINCINRAIKSPPYWTSSKFVTSRSSHRSVGYYFYYDVGIPYIRHDTLEVGNIWKKKFFEMLLLIIWQK